MLVQTTEYQNADLGDIGGVMPGAELCQCGNPRGRVGHLGLVVVRGWFPQFTRADGRRLSTQQREENHKHDNRVDQRPLRGQ